MYPPREKIPTSCTRLDHTLFSESHDRFIISTKHHEKVKDFLVQKKIPSAEIGLVTGDKKCKLKLNNKIVIDLQLSEIIKNHECSLLDILEKNVKETT